jgi:hypothetical protein
MVHRLKRRTDKEHGNEFDCQTKRKMSKTWGGGELDNNVISEQAWLSVPQRDNSEAIKDKVAEYEKASLNNTD